MPKYNNLMEEFHEKKGECIMRKVRIVLVASLLFLMSFTSSVFAVDKPGVVYTALGDSIAYGTGGTGGIGYTDLFNDHLIKIYGEGDFHKHAQDGLSSADLLEMLMVTSDVYGYRAAISQSDYITISIGGNDLLFPFMQEFAFVIVYHYYDFGSGVVDFEGLMEDLDAWQNDPTNPEFAYFGEMLTNLSYVTFPNAITAFANNWAQIIGTIRTLNPTATIFVNTGYNPFVNIPMLQEWVDPFVQSINAIIMNDTLVQMYDYKVVDVYTAFKDYANPKKLEVGDLSNLAQFSLDNDSVPVPLHPTDLGYKFIFNLHKDLLE